jgi:enoyl-[acyl-carrier protein] reductase I
LPAVLDTFEGTKVRVNTISQSPTATKAGQAVKGFNGFIAFADKMAPLGNASFRLCKLYGRYVFRFDKMVTLQNLYMMADSLIWE